MGRTVGIHGAGMIPISRMGGPLGAPPLDFLYDTFTPGMAKRATGVFAASPIVQGNWDGTGTPDAVTLPVGAQFSNPTDYCYANLDPYRGSVVFWITPEWDGDDGLAHYIFYNDAICIWKLVGNTISCGFHDGVSWREHIVSTVAWTAGTTYLVVFRWDSQRTLDGTNHCCVSVNGAHSFGISSVSGVVKAPTATSYFGYHSASIYPASALIEGFTIYRRPLFDDTYGVAGTFDASGPIDEIAAIYAAGAGADPCLTTGSWDVVFCLPTDATEEVLVTGTGEAWSHPHLSTILNHWTLEDAFYGGAQWVVAFNGTSTSIDCGSAAVLDDLPAGGNILTVDAWVRADSGGDVRIIACKGDTTTDGWVLRRITGPDRIVFAVRLATTDVAALVTFPADGKWHHVVGYYNDTTKTARVAVDGIWGSASVGVGAYQADALYDLRIGRRSDSGSQFWNGAIGWLRLSNNDRHTAGTDFIPPREFPGADGNTVEAWSLNDGTGGTAVAQVTTPGNDGTITAGTWEQQWDDVLTPVYPTSLESSDTSFINCGSGATLDDLPIGANGFTAEAWVRPDITDAYQRIFSKDNSTVGWFLYLHQNQWAARVRYPGTTTVVYASVPDGDDSIWHHIAITYDEGGDRRLRIWIDGIIAATGIVSVGVYATDAALTMFVSSYLGVGNEWEGGIGWVRISDNIRYTANFVPPDRVNQPGIDGNTMMQLDMTQGAGLTATDTSGNANHGAITMGTGRWWNTPDAENEGPGSRVYQWGYDIGSDGANDGVHQHLAGLAAGQNYVARIPVRYEADKRCQPSIVAYDETNGAAISTFLGPWLTGTHDGGAAQADLSDSTAPYWPYSLVGGTVYNITDGSSATITTAGNSIVGGLAGGGSNDWNNGEVYFIVPPAEWVWADPFCFELPTIARNGAAADCVEISFRLLNSAGEGVIYWNQVEVLENLVDNPSLETGAGNPWLPDGAWAFQGAVGVGQSLQEVAIIHSGAACDHLTVDDTEGLQLSWAYAASGRYMSWGSWINVVSGTILSTGGPRWVRQYDRVAYGAIFSTTTAAWRHYTGVLADDGVGLATLYPDRAFGGAAEWYFDDAYAVLLDDVSLTVIPASEANSAETSGLRVDGQDLCSLTPPAGRLLAAQGWLRWNWTPRHDAADLAGFAGAANLPYLVYVFGDANNHIIVEVTAANTIQLDVTANAINAVANWNCAAQIVAGTTYLMEVRWDGNWFRFIVDNVLVAQVSPAAMAIDTAIVYWGCDAAPIHEADAVYAAP